MRFIVIALSVALMAFPPIAAASQVEGSAEVCLEKTSEEYQCEWQKRLLAVQQRFAATLPAIDQVTTGSITHSDR